MDQAKRLGLKIAEAYQDKPWGAFIRFQEDSAKRFLELYFPTLSYDPNLPITPKYLLVAPGKRLSWQYHKRRQELWRVLEGPVGVALSLTDAEMEPKIFQTNEVIEVPLGARHRIVGLDNWAVLAEIWRHTDPDNPSDEADIVRLQDDFADFGADKYR